MIERILIKLCKLLKVRLLLHAHVQIGAGHNTYLSGEEGIIKNVIATILQRDPQMIFDVGANVGNYTSLLRAKFGAAVIHSFEPVPANFAALLKRTANLNVNCHPFGLSSREEDLMLYQGTNDEDGAMSTLYRDALDDLFPFNGNSVSVATCRFSTLDQFCAANEIQNIDFLKIDVEGHELQVIKGASQMIAANRILILQFEFNEFNIISRSFMKDFYDILSSYELYRVMPEARLFKMGDYSSELEIFRYQNILAIHKNLSYE